jgi:hypothetical protein
MFPLFYFIFPFFRKGYGMMNENAFVVVLIESSDSDFIENA